MAKNKKLIKQKKKYQKLQERYEEMDDYLVDLMENISAPKKNSDFFMICPLQKTRRRVSLFQRTCTRR